MDQCMHCECKGNIKKCFSVDCGKHEDWIFKELLLYIDPIVIKTFNSFRGGLEQLKRNEGI